MRIDLTIPTRLLGRIEISIHITLPSLLPERLRTRARLLGRERGSLPIATLSDEATSAS